LARQRAPERGSHRRGGGGADRRSRVVAWAARTTAPVPATVV
jgi:hypothetical protein